MFIYSIQENKILWKQHLTDIQEKVWNKEKEEFNDHQNFTVQSGVKAKIISSKFKNLNFSK